MFIIHVYYPTFEASLGFYFISQEILALPSTFSCLNIIFFFLLIGLGKSNFDIPWTEQCCVQTMLMSHLTPLGSLSLSQTGNNIPNCFPAAENVPV